MTPADIKAARRTLGLSVRDFAAMLETDDQTVRRMEMDSDRSTARPPAQRMARLIRAYLDGWRPADWPKPAPPPKPDMLAILAESMTPGAVCLERLEGGEWVARPETRQPVGPITVRSNAISVPLVYLTAGGPGVYRMAVIGKNGAPIAWEDVGHMTTGQSVPFSGFVLGA